MMPLAAECGLVRLSWSISTDDGAGQGTGKPDIVGSDVDKEYQRSLVTLEVYYQAIETLGIGVALPYADLHLEDNASGTEGDRSGFSDLRSYLLWSPWLESDEEKDWLSFANLNIIFGLTLPTVDDEIPSAPVGRDGQLGSGSLDVRLGATYWGVIDDHWAVYGSYNLQLDTGDDYTGYRNSASHSWRVGGGYTPWSWFSVYASFRANSSGPNMNANGEVVNTGATLWYVSPSLIVRPSSSFWFDMAASLPVYHRVEGQQVLPGDTWTVGITFLW